MIAAKARALKVGDWVRANFAQYAKDCEIIEIRWPVLTLKTTSSRGEVMIRDRNYRSLIGMAKKRPGHVPPPCPSWLQWPELSEK
jgi:hypothetical protein